MYWLQVQVAELFNDQPSGAYWYKNGVNPKAVAALAPAVVIGLVFTLVPQLQHLAPFNWFIGAFLGAVFYYFLARPSVALTLQAETKTLGK
jgi:NCS1 family nucleobase:cation symporter-1